MRRWILAGCLCGVVPAVCQTASREVVTDARQAMSEGMPEIAVLQLRKALEKPLSGEEKLKLRLALADALVATGDGEGTLAALEGLPSSPAYQLTFGKALALGAEWAAAEAAFLRAAADPALADEARFYSAEAARLSGGWNRALPIYQSLAERPVWADLVKRRLAVHALESGDLEKAEEYLQNARVPDKEGVVLRARLQLAKGDYSAAHATLEPLVKDTKGLSSELATVAVAANAEALKKLKREAEAARILQQFIEQYALNPYLRDVIHQLIQLDRRAAEESLSRWAAEPPAVRQGQAALALATLRIEEKKWEEAALVLKAFGAPPLSGHPLAVEGLRKLLRLQLAASQWNAVLETIGLLSPEVSESELVELTHTKARIALEQGKYADAGAIYRSLAEMPGVSDEEQRLYFRALAALWSGEEEAFGKSYQEFSGRFPKSASRPGLLLDRGLFLAQRKDARAVEALSKFVQEFPSDPRVDEARLALAELAFLGEPRDPASATKWLDQISGASEKADYLRLWIHASSSEGEAEIGVAKSFLEKWPLSAKRPFVLFKLGESYFGKEDYANAQAAFERLALEFPEHELTGRANYLAGVAMLRTMNTDALDNAILALERAVRRDPAVRNMARLAQAEAYVKGGREEEALVVYEDILKSSPDASTRAAALCGKGEMLLSQGKDRIDAAIEAFDTVTRDPQIDRYWKQEALWRKAKGLEMAGDPDGALLGYYEAVKFGDEIRHHPGGELFWYFKAGFDAARLLEAKERWSGAIAMYQKLAALSGARSEEAATRAKRLQLEYYIWDESGQ